MGGAASDRKYSRRALNGTAEQRCANSHDRRSPGFTTHCVNDIIPADHPDSNDTGYSDVHSERVVMEVPSGGDVCPIHLCQVGRTGTKNMCRPKINRHDTELTMHMFDLT